MWPEEEHYERGRASSASEVVFIGQQQPAPAAADALPVPGRPYFINRMNISTSPGARIGDNYVTVTNVHHADEVVKARFLGLELISPVHARRLRCSVAVFVCWALVLASGLAIYFFHFALSTRYRIDIDLPCGKYTWAYVKNSTRAERIVCSVSTILLAACVSLAVYFIVFYKVTGSPDNENWYITREVWLAEAYENDDIQTDFEPLRLVVIQHTANRPECSTYHQCCIALRNLQTWFINKRDRDIPYNFLVGNDGRVYEGRGWHKEGAFLIGYNKCSVGIGFIGDYREEAIDAATKVTELQQNRLHKILDMGIKLGYLHPDYKVIGAKDLQNDPEYQSPGSNLYNAMQHWPHFDFGGRFKEYEIAITTIQLTLSNHE